MLNRDIFALASVIISRSEMKCVAGTCGTRLEQRARVDRADRIGLDILRTCAPSCSWIRLPFHVRLASVL
jgi:hypothetical protein